MQWGLCYIFLSSGRFYFWHCCLDITAVLIQNTVHDYVSVGSRGTDQKHSAEVFEKKKTQGKVNSEVCFDRPPQNSC